MKKAPLKISIVTTVLNGAPTLSQALHSVSTQSHQDWEHIIVDAGSIDGSYEIAKRAADKDKRVQTFQRPGETMYRSILWGLDKATGDYLSWLNADDIYTQWAFAALADFAKTETDPDWISGLPGCWDEHGVLHYVRPEGWRPQSLIKAGWFHKDLLGFIQQESIFFSRDLYRSLSSTERDKIAHTTLAGDFILWKSFAERSQLTVMPTVLGGFRRHGANRSIVGIDTYMREVKAAGGLFLPFPLNAACQFVYRCLTSYKAAKLSLKADLRLMAKNG